MFLVIDNALVLRQEFEPLEQIVNEIAARGLTYGVHVVITANRWAEVRPALKDLIGTRFELRLGDPADSEVDRRVAINVPAGSPGRGITKAKLHFLGALPRIDGSSSTVDLAERGAGVLRGGPRRMVAARRRRPVRMLPDLIEYDELPQSAGAPGQLLLGIDEAELAPVYLDVDADPHLLVFGDGESGKTGLLRALARGIVERYTPDQARIAVVDYRRTLLGAVPDTPPAGVRRHGQVADRLRSGHRRRDGATHPGPGRHLRAAAYPVMVEGTGALRPGRRLRPRRDPVRKPAAAAGRSHPAGQGHRPACGDRQTFAVAPPGRCTTR